MLADHPNETAFRLEDLFSLPIDHGPVTCSESPIPHAGQQDSHVPELSGEEAGGWWQEPLGLVKYCSDFRGKIVYTKRFVHKMNALLQYAVLNNEILRVS